MGGLIPLHTEDVDTERRRERRQRRVCTAEGGRDDADGEEDDDRLPQYARGTEHRQDVVARVGQGDAELSGQGDQQDAQREEEEVDRRKGQAVGVHILLCVAQATAGEVLLHHVLIQSGHDDRDKDAAQELLHKVLLARPIVPLEEAEVRALGHRAAEAVEVQPHAILHLPDDHHERAYEAERLKRVCPDDRLDAALVGVEPYEQDAQDNGHAEGDLPRREDVRLEDKHHEIESRGRTDDLGEEEEGGARLVSPPTDARLEVGVDGRELKAVVERQEHVRDDDVTEKEAEDGLHVRHVDLPHPAGNGYERHARERRADHADGHDVPR